MKLRTKIVIAAEPAAVWPLVADPTWHPKWNPKARDVLRDSQGPVAAGEKFEMVYALNRDEQLSQVEVVDLQPGERVGFCHRVEHGNRMRVAIESYALSPLATGVKLVQTIDLSGAGIPWLLRPLIWLLDRFGTSQGAQPLEELKKIAERQ